MLDLNDGTDDIIETLVKNGFPTFEEFVKNKHKWMKKPFDETLECVDGGDKILGARQRYYVDGYWVPSLEAAETTAKNMGLNLRTSFDFFPQITPDLTEKCGYYIAVHFKAKPVLGKYRNLMRRPGLARTLK